MKKLLAILLAAIMVIPMFAACKPKGSGKTAKPTEVPEFEDYTAKCDAIYDAQLGEFMEYYSKAFDAKTSSERWALMAIAEAKLLESGVMLPGTTRGGRYQMAYTVRRSGSTVMWGSDPDRQHTIMVTNELIKKEDNDALLDIWNRVQGTGTYTAEAKKYLTEHGYTFNPVLNSLYSSDPVTFDVLSTSRQPDAQPVVMTFDGLIEYDNENIMKPALAESWEKSDDGLTYTFHIRQGVKWVDNQGTEVADVTADDFVAGMNHLMDCGGGLDALLTPIIAGAAEYSGGETTDFATVGVKAVDTYTLQYTLKEPCPYFLSMLAYSIFAPMNREYFLAKGGAFGQEEYQAAVDSGKCVYGTSHETIAYCGPYLIKGHVDKNSFNFIANPAYWNPDNVICKEVNWTFTDGTDPTLPYELTKKGEISGCGLSRANLESAKQEKPEGEDKTYFELYARVSDTDATSFINFININRTAYANFNDETKGVTKLTEEEKVRTQRAVWNKHFRRAIGMGLDMAKYNGVITGEELALVSVRNSYVPGNFIMLDEETTVEINGKAKTYPAGTYFGEIRQDQIDADGVKIKTWDREKKTSDGFAGWYNPENAMEELTIAIAELKNEGIEISPENPIHLELPNRAQDPVFSARAVAFKQTVEESLQGNVIVDLIDYMNDEDYLSCAFNIENGQQANFTMFDGSGWGPDYGDPQTYLDTVQKGVDGYMNRVMGLY